MLNCQEVTEKASEYLDNALPWRQRLEIRLHLFLCHHCRRYLRQLRTVTIAFREMSTSEVSEEAIERQVEKLSAYFSLPEDRERG